MASFYKAPVLVLWLNNLYYIIRLLCGGCTWIPFISWQIIVFFKCSQVFPSEGVLSTDRGHELWPNGPQSLLACVNTILGRGSLSRKNHHPLILLLAVSVISVHQHNAVVYNNSDSCHSMASSSTIFVCSFLVLNVVPSAMWVLNKTVLEGLRSPTWILVSFSLILWQVLGLSQFRIQKASPRTSVPPKLRE